MNSLVRSCHRQGDISGYFLGPGTVWSLTFEDVIDQVLKENIRHLGLRRSKAVASLRSYNERRTALQLDIDVSTNARDVSPNSPEGRELDSRLTTLQTALGGAERAIVAAEATLEDCQRMEEEARWEARREQAIPEELEDETTDTEMADDEARDDQGPADEEDLDEPEPTDLQEEAGGLPTVPPHGDADPTPLALGGVVTAEEDALLMQAASQAEGPATGPQSPWSEAGTFSGEMAELSIASPDQPEVAEDETPR